MVNEKRGSFWEEQVYAVVVAVASYSAVVFFVGVQHVGWAYLFGALYGMLSYECWLSCLDNFGSMIYEEDEEPVVLDGKHACIALFLPIGLMVAITVACLCFIIAWGWYLYDSAMGHHRIRG